MLLSVRQGGAVPCCHRSPGESVLSGPLFQLWNGHMLWSGPVCRGPRAAGEVLYCPTRGAQPHQPTGLVPPFLISCLLLLSSSLLCAVTHDPSVCPSLGFPCSPCAISALPGCVMPPPQHPPALCSHTDTHLAHRFWAHTAPGRVKESWNSLGWKGP